MSAFSHVIVLENINDIGIPGLFGATDQEVFVDQIVSGYQQMIQRAHSHGIKIIDATPMPYKTAI